MSIGAEIGIPRLSDSGILDRNGRPTWLFLRLQPSGSINQIGGIPAADSAAQW